MTAITDKKKLDLIIKIARHKKIRYFDIFPSPKPQKKYRIILLNGRHLDFGAYGMEDFLDHRDPERLWRFHQRFKNNVGYNDPNSALYYSQNLLW